MTPLTSCAIESSPLSGRNGVAQLIRPFPGRPRLGGDDTTITLAENSGGALHDAQAGSRAGSARADRRRGGRGRRGDQAAGREASRSAVAATSRPTWEAALIGT